MELLNDLQSFLDTIESLGGDACPLRVDPPAKEEDIRSVEAEIGLSIPPELRRVMLSVSAHFEFRWMLDDSIELPQPLRELFSGELHWGLDLTPDFVETHAGWVRDAFPKADDPYDSVWHNKFPFQEVGNGDFLSIDSEGRIVYLSHDDGRGHGYVMANSFADLLVRWVPLGCVGGEDWQWLPFTNGMSTRIDPYGEASASWKALLGRK